MQKFFITLVCLVASATATFAGTINVEMKLRIDRFELFDFIMNPVDRYDTDPAKYHDASSVSIDDPNIAILGYEGELVGGGIGDEIVLSFSAPLGEFSYFDWPPSPLPYESLSCQLGTYKCDPDWAFYSRATESSFTYSPTDTMQMSGSGGVSKPCWFRLCSSTPVG